MAMLRQETRRLELGIQRYLGEEKRFYNYDELTKLEQELENSVAKVRNRQVMMNILSSSLINHLLANY